MLVVKPPRHTANPRCFAAINRAHGNSSGMSGQLSSAKGARGASQSCILHNSSPSTSPAGMGSHTEAAVTTSGSLIIRHLKSTIPALAAIRALSQSHDPPFSATQPPIALRGQRLGTQVPIRALDIPSRFHDDPELEESFDPPQLQPSIPDPPRGDRKLGLNGFPEAHSLGFMVGAFALNLSAS